MPVAHIDKAKRLTLITLSVWAGKTVTWKSIVKRYGVHKRTALRDMREVINIYREVVGESPTVREYDNDEMEITSAHSKTYIRKQLDKVD